MLLGRLRVREKLALLVLLPLVAVVGTAAPLVVGRLHAVSQARRSADVVSAAVQVGTLIQQLQQERLLSLGYLATGDGRDQLVVRSAEVEDRIAQVRTDVGARVSALLPPALDTVAALDLVRTRVLRQDIDPDTLFTAYSNAIGVLIDAISLHQDANTSTDTGRQELALDALIRHDEATSSAGAALFVGFSGEDQINARVIALVSAAASVQDTQERLFLSLASASAKTLYRLVQEGPASQAVERYLSRVTGDPVGAVGDKVTDDLLPGVESLTALSRLVQIKIARDVSRESSSAANRAAGVGVIVIVTGLLLLTLVVVLSVLVAQAIAQPLRRLTASAENVADVAQQELVRVSDEENLDVAPPHLVPVQVGTTDELGELAAAFNRVQQVAAELVERQLVSRRNVATMFGNVGRRTQNLVGRQLAMIDTLERDEQDPAVLERLYRLDHVSTRLRRNANSLVVLSGAVEPSLASEPLSIADAIRSALGEIEGFQRVRLRETDEARLAPHAATDVMLLLAELLENSTSFSPPHTEVNVTAHAVAAGCQVTIVDHGIGMTDQQLTDENARLVQRERLDLAPTDVLGLFVVGRLSRRHGINVRLRATEGTGVTAEVTIPRGCLISLIEPGRTNWPASLPVGRAEVGLAEAEPDWGRSDRNGHSTSRSAAGDADLLESAVPAPAGLLDADGPGAGRPTGGTRQISFQPTDPAPGHHPTAPPVQPIAFRPADPPTGPAPAGAGQPGEAGGDLTGLRPPEPFGPGAGRWPGAAGPGAVGFHPSESGEPGQPGWPGGTEPSAFRPSESGGPGAGGWPDAAGFRAAEADRPDDVRSEGGGDEPPAWPELVGFGPDDDLDDLAAGGLTGPAEPAGGPETPVLRRVPGAQLPDPGPPAAPSWSLRETPEEARKVAEDFEAGADRAEYAVRPPSQAAEPVELELPLLDRWERLRRRVPGSHLPPSPGAAEPGEPPLTPDSARALVDEFETGVKRALDNLAAVTARYAHTDTQRSESPFAAPPAPASAAAPPAPVSAADLPPMARRVPQPVPPPAPWPSADPPGGRHANVEPPSRLADGPPAPRQPRRPGDDTRPGDDARPGPSLGRPYERFAGAHPPGPAEPPADPAHPAPDTAAGAGDGSHQPVAAEPETAATEPAGSGAGPDGPRPTGRSRSGGPFRSGAASPADASTGHPGRPSADTPAATSPARPADQPLDAEQSAAEPGSATASSDRPHQQPARSGLSAAGLSAAGLSAAGLSATAPARPADQPVGAEQSAAEPGSATASSGRPYEQPARSGSSPAGLDSGTASSDRPYEQPARSGSSPAGPDSGVESSDRPYQPPARSGPDGVVTPAEPAVDAGSGDMAGAAAGPADGAPVGGEAARVVPVEPADAPVVRVVEDEPRRRSGEPAGERNGAGRLGIGRRNSLIRLNRRVPGAQLPDTGSRTNDLAPAPELDPDAARALVEEFEAGVARAMESAHDGRSSPGDPERPGSTEGSER